MRYVDHVPDRLVTGLVYRHMPCWYAVACYFDWRKHYAGRQALEHLKRNPAMYARMHGKGAVLTDAGWVLPVSPRNPRIIDQPGASLVTQAELEEQERIDAEVDDTRIEHEAAVLHEDMAVFSLQWQAVIRGGKRAAGQLRKVAGHSEEREAYMVRWHAENYPH